MLKVLFSTAFLLGTFVFADPPHQNVGCCYANELLWGSECYAACPTGYEHLQNICVQYACLPGETTLPYTGANGATMCSYNVCPPLPAGYSFSRTLGCTGGCEACNASGNCRCLIYIPETYAVPNYSLHPVVTPQSFPSNTIGCPLSGTRPHPL